jgi:tetratricopeptide (TPR) repeat protein
VARAQTRLSGEIFRLPDGRLRRYHTGGREARGTVRGSRAELDILLDRGAEAVYAQTQPYRYTNWLGEQGRNEEAANLRKELAFSPDENDRVWANISMGSASSGYRERLHYYEQALRIRPGFMTAHYGIANTQSSTGRRSRP